MHNITKIKLFRIVLRITYLPSLLFLYPIILLKRKPKGNIFFFFDRYSLGGAQRVHLDILKAVESANKMVFFTRKSADDTFKSEFERIKQTSFFFIENYCDHFLIRIFSVHYYAFLINKYPNTKVLSSNSTFFYDMLPFIRKEVTTLELLHNFTFGKNGMEFFGLMNYSRLSVRLTIDSATRENIISQYRQYQIPDSYVQRIRTIEFGVDIPAEIPEKSAAPLKVFYAGRGGPQKRIHLINEIALHFIRRNEPVTFYFAGTFDDELTEEVRQNSVCYGPVADKKIMETLFSESHILLMTSAYEGFPVLIKEAMAHGCVPVVTALPGILTHLQDGENSLLIQSVSDEQKVVEEGIRHIQFLLQQNQVLKKISRTCFDYASRHFSKKPFYQAYAELLG